MSDTVPLPTQREIYLDPRGDGRGMRVTCHPEHGVVVVSLWRERECVGTMHLPQDEVPRLLAQLAQVLYESGSAGGSTQRASA